MEIKVHKFLHRFKWFRYSGKNHFRNYNGRLIVSFKCSKCGELFMETNITHLQYPEIWGKDGN